MKILNLERGMGNTTALVNACYLGNKALVVCYSGMRTAIRENNPIANKIDIFTIGEVVNGCLMGRSDKEVYVDEIDMVLAMLFKRYHAQMVGGTITTER